MSHLSTQRLVEELKHANDAYRMGNPVMSDDEYDAKLYQLQQADPSHPFLQQVGTVVSTTATNRIRLPFWMGSLSKIKDDPEALTSFVNRYPGPYVVSDKLDGNSLGLDVVNGQPHIFSRGDGYNGQSLDAFIPYIAGIPSIFPRDQLQVRGEVIIPKSKWDSSLGTNPRNVVAGALHKKTPDPELCAKMEFIAYELLYPVMPLSEGLEWLESNGFHVVPHTRFHSLDFQELSDILQDRRQESPWECDGIVIMNDQNPAPIPGKNPTYGFAMKSILLHEEAERIVTGVEWSISKDRYWKPTVLFEPVVLGQATLQKATGFNAAFIERERIGPGARIIVVRSGDVIPFIKNVIHGAATPCMPPDGQWVWSTNRVDAIAPSGVYLAEQQEKILLHFVQTITPSDVKSGMGPAMIKKLVEQGVADVVTLWRTHIPSVLGTSVTTTKAQAAFEVIKERVTLETLAVGSNSFGHGFGTRLLTTILNRIPEYITTRRIPSIEVISSIEGVGVIRAEQFLEALPGFYTLLDAIRFVPAAAVTSNTDTNTNTTEKQGWIVVFTGFRDAALKQSIESQGGKVVDSLTSKTTHLVVKNITETSTKITQAKEKNIPIFDIETFRRL